MVTMPSDQISGLDALLNSLNLVSELVTTATLKILAAIIIFLFGWLFAFIVRFAVSFVLEKIKIKEWLESLGLGKYFENFTWEERLDHILAEVVFWVILAVFLMSSFEVLGLSAVNFFLRSVISYIPKALAGALILLFGFVFGDLMRKIASGFLHSLNKKAAKFASAFIKWSIVVVAFFAALNQWGIAVEVVNTLLLGVVLFLALAGGLAFGLGGQETAREVLESLKRELK